MLNIPYNYNVRHTITNKSDFFLHIIHTGGKTFCDQAFMSLFWRPSLSSDLRKVSLVEQSLQLHSQLSFHCLMFLFPLLFATCFHHKVFYSSSHGSSSSARNAFLHWAIPFNIPSSPMDEVSKILTPKKKNQSADTKSPSEICKFSPYPSEKLQRSKDANT